jgi:hypothetical protein
MIKSLCGISGLRLPLVGLHDKLHPACLAWVLSGPLPIPDNRCGRPTKTIPNGSILPSPIAPSFLSWHMANEPVPKPRAKQYKGGR